MVEANYLDSSIYLNKIVNLKYSQPFVVIKCKYIETIVIYLA